MAQLIKRTTATGENRYDVRTRIAGRVVTRTFKRRKDADVYANTTEADKLRGVVVDPRRARVTLQEYAGQWLAHRPDLAVRTRELYGWLLDRHILPTLEASTHCAFHLLLLVEKAGLGSFHLDSQALSPSSTHVDGLELAALYTLQHRLAADAERPGGFEHGQPAGWCSSTKRERRSSVTRMRRGAPG